MTIADNGKLVGFEVLTAVGTNMAVFLKEN
jgi:hypothetical protein